MGCKAIVWICSLLAAMATQAATPTAAAPCALLTIADGSVTVLRGRVRFAAAEGQRLEPLDIVQTDATARVARLEFGDGTVLDLGPATHVLLQPQGTAWPKERTAAAYIAQGWAKLRTPRGANLPAGSALASAALDLATAEGGVVLAHIEADAAFVFVEAGRAQLIEYRAPRAPRMLTLGEGHAYSRGGTADIGTAALRASPAQLRQTPRALADTLPLRASLWARSAAPALVETQAVQAAELTLWLDTDSALRRSMRARFAGTAHAPGQSFKPSLYRTTATRTGASTKPMGPKALPTARLAPARLAGTTTAERSRLAEPLPTERLSAPVSIASLMQMAPMVVPALSNPPIYAPTAKARARVSP